MKRNWRSKSEKKKFRKTLFSFLCLPLLLAMTIFAELYLFPEILAPDYIRFVEEENDSGEVQAETEEMRGKPEAVFRFYDSSYRIVWKFF